MRHVLLRYPRADLIELRKAVEYAYINESNTVYKGRLLQLLNEISKHIEGENK